MLDLQIQGSFFTFSIFKSFIQCYNGEKYAKNDIYLYISIFSLLSIASMEKTILISVVIVTVNLTGQERVSMQDFELLKVLGTGGKYSWLMYSTYKKYFL